jgi:hypothetical protein
MGRRKGLFCKVISGIEGDKIVKNNNYSKNNKNNSVCSSPAGTG